MQSSPAQQDNPLLPGYNFNAYLVAGMTPIVAGEALDFTINRPNGMKGYIINLTTDGIGTIFQGDDQFNCSAGDLLLFPPNATHYYHRAENSPLWHHQWIYFRPRALWKDWLNWSDTVNHVGRLTVTDCNEYQRILTLFKQIEQEYRHKGLFYEEMSMCLLEQLLLTCFKLDPSNKQRMLDPRVLSACHFITDNLGQNHKIADIANAIHISPSRLAHLFVQQTGSSMIKWREEQRMIKAQHLLHTSNAPIYHIARILGYDDQLYFCRLFKRHTGLNPSEYRNSR
ncbi:MULTISPECIES: arabinose operon transcriptional regulator AraC [Lonepinella]|uniref:AraC family transcriptional regulator n=1 Tax=Lonepinella koalarum TaxID=53417 RepID=A0A4R1L2V4_9PAST|nr:arabinose operon transcriptional regulator AraC [Lonepinella koalarum]MDH2926179.1 DNA-binding transcriptional regulator AraC [Lonepinella koalarum]TCK71330.1 AraC family transcriptional regulator [Lonepinella koalarum]TFJ91047.1 arabinose operon transcriptional regulator AraC [Lonepinella koalarum]